MIFRELNKPTFHIRSGLKKTRYSHRDYDFFKTKKLDTHKLGALVPTFPDNYCTDVGLWMPDQNADGMPYGCTDYAQTDLIVDEDKKLYNPQDIEAITHANKNGGSDLRTSLKAVVKLHPDHPAFFAVVPDIDKGGYLDWFDAVRCAMVLGKMENRAVSIGTPWFPEFMAPLEGIIRASLNWIPSLASWHNWNCKGWKTINGVTYLIAKPWIGKNYGDNGYSYFNRADFNRLMSIPGTAAFTLDKLMPGEQPQTVDSTIKQWLVSLFWQILGI